MSEATTRLNLTGEEIAYTIYCIGFTYTHMSKHQQGIVIRILSKIVEAEKEM